MTVSSECAGLGEVGSDTWLSLLSSRGGVANVASEGADWLSPPGVASLEACTGRTDSDSRGVVACEATGEATGDAIGEAIGVAIDDSEVIGESEAIGEGEAIGDARGAATGLTTSWRRLSLELLLRSSFSPCRRLPVDDALPVERWRF